MKRFLADFGLRVVEETDDALAFAGVAQGPPCYRLRRGNGVQFLGLGFAVPTKNMLDALAVAHDAPVSIGGPHGDVPTISLTDPAGHTVTVSLLDRPVLPDLGPAVERNERGRVARVNHALRQPVAPATVLRLGHCVIRTPLLMHCVDWYQKNLGLIASDIQLLPSGTPALVFLRCDAGAVPVDHHSLVFALSPEPAFGHASFEVADTESLALGHQHLRTQGWRPWWGIGRHLMGSQMFDYWLAPNGFEHEHYSDGDLLTADFPTETSPFTIASLWAWGPDFPVPPLPAVPPGIPAPFDEVLGVLATAGRPWISGGRQ